MASLDAQTIVDAVGLGPLGKLRISGNRVLAALVALAAVAVTAIPRIETGSGSLPLLLALLAVTAGAGIAVQQALNARVAVAAKYAPSAAVVNFVVGTAVLAAVLLLGTVLADWRTGPLPTQPLLYFGGPIGVAFIAIAAWAVPKVGVLNFALASIAGQLAGGALLDMLFPQPGVTVGPALLLGLALTGIAVMIGNRRG
jgi:transporter family-2 protein